MNRPQNSSNSYNSWLKKEGDVPVGRVKENIAVNGKQFWTLFDTGSRNTYVINKVAKYFPRIKLDQFYDVKLGGKNHKLEENIILKARLSDTPIATRAFVIDEIGVDEKGQEIQVLFGALGMQEWGIELDLKREKVDLTHYPKEFIEF
ncbi:MAG: hypothetical protein AB1414_15755 [bacterium]